MMSGRSILVAPGRDALRGAETAMRFCRRLPVLDLLVRVPLSALWAAAWAAYFTLRNRLRNPIIDLEVHGARLYVDLRDATIARRLYWFGVYEPEESALVQTLLRPGMTVVDVGANVGYYTLLFSRLVGRSGRVLAFEPCPDNRHLIDRSLEANAVSNVTLLPQALADRPGAGTLVLSDTNLGAHSLGRPAGHQAVKSIGVDCVRFDDIAREHGLRPDFIKLDIEGAEHLALQGMRDTLTENPDIRLLCEFNPAALTHCGSSPHCLIRDLTRLGFRFFRVGPSCHLDEISANRLLADVPDGRHINLLLSRRDPRSLPGGER